MKEKFIYEGGKGLRRGKVLETGDESSEKFIYRRGKGDEGGFHAHPYPRMRAPKGALYTEGFK